MRCGIVPLLFLAGFAALTLTMFAATQEAPAPSTFDSKVRPILEAKCRPCHFEGGKVYARLPFDRPETARRLGERLFTRLKDEKDRATIRAFLRSPR